MIQFAWGNFFPLPLTIRDPTCYIPLCPPRDTPGIHKLLNIAVVSYFVDAEVILRHNVKEIEV
jgi:hypothetical protein